MNQGSENAIQVATLSPDECARFITESEKKTYVDEETGGIVTCYERGDGTVLITNIKLPEDDYPIPPPRKDW